MKRELTRDDFAWHDAVCMEEGLLLPIRNPEDIFYSVVSGGEGALYISENAESSIGLVCDVDRQDDYTWWPFQGEDTEEWRQIITKIEEMFGYEIHQS